LKILIDLLYISGVFNDCAYKGKSGSLITAWTARLINRINMARLATYRWSVISTMMGSMDRAVFRGVTKGNNWFFDYNMDGTTDKQDRYGQIGDLPVIWTT
jgi:hypothetical protein